MDSKDSFSCLRANANVANESTPIKSETTNRKSFAFTPISDINSLHSVDIDSAYFSSLKKSRVQCSPISSFSSRFNQSYSYLEYDVQPTKIDLLSELFKRSIFHVIKMILSKLNNAEYAKLTRVSKNWLCIVQHDLAANKQRQAEIKKERKTFRKNKENIMILISNTKNSSSIIDCLLDLDENVSRFEQATIESTINEGTSFKFLGAPLCSQQSKRNLKRL